MSLLNVFIFTFILCLNSNHGDATCSPDCAMKEWSAWSNCSTTCGGGVRTREKMLCCIKTVKPYNLEHCLQHCHISKRWWDSNATETKSCNNVCLNGNFDTRRNRCNCHPGFSGKCCETASTYSCGGKFNVCDIQPWTAWSSCSSTCGRGTQSRNKPVCCNPSVVHPFDLPNCLSYCKIDKHMYQNQHIESRDCGVCKKGAYNSLTKSCVCPSGLTGACCDKVITTTTKRTRKPIISMTTTKRRTTITQKPLTKQTSMTTVSSKSSTKQTISARTSQLSMTKTTKRQTTTTKSTATTAKTSIVSRTNSKHTTVRARPRHTTATTRNPVRKTITAKSSTKLKTSKSTTSKHFIASISSTHGQAYGGISKVSTGANTGHARSNTNAHVGQGNVILTNTTTMSCAGNPCFRGNCLQLPTRYMCLCEPGFEGAQCDLDKDDCASSPCQRGSCSDLVNSYHCKCDMFFEGKKCSKLKTWAIIAASMVALTTMLVMCCCFWLISSCKKRDGDNCRDPPRQTKVRPVIPSGPLPKPATPGKLNAWM